MKSQITMKDIARHFNVSLNTVHKSIYGKSGVSEATRQRIVNYAQENGYRLNSIASIMKRKSICIAICLPELDEDSKYFYSYIWQGCHRYLDECSAYNIQVKEIPYKKGRLMEAYQSLEQLLNTGEKIDGMLTVPSEEEQCRKLIRSFANDGISVVFVTGDQPECEKLGAVTGDYFCAGQIMAEQACNLLGNKKHILLLAGRPYKDSHYLVAKGFHAYINEFGRRYEIEDLFGYYESDRLSENIVRILSQNKPDIICCVFARGSTTLYRTLQSSGWAGKIPVIASDLFDASVEALRDGTFTNIVFKDPYKQSYMAIKMLCEYLLLDREPQERIRKVEVSMIFRSNASYYWENISEMQYMRTEL